MIRALINAFRFLRACREFKRLEREESDRSLAHRHHNSVEGAR